jgi:lipopolysaccharide transport system permease protein
MSEPASPVIETTIAPTSGWHWIRWKEIYAYRDLLWLLVWRDIASRYKQTVLGPLWFVVQPLMTTIVFMAVFSRVAHIPTNGVPSSLFYLCGLLPWNYFAQTFQSTSGSLVNNATMLGKVYFPRLIVPLSTVISNLVPLAIQLLTYFVVYVALKLGPLSESFNMDVATVWLLPLVFAQVALFSLGVGLWVAALTAKFRDFGILAGFILQLWMYATPVVWPLSLVQSRWYWVAKLNPLTFPLEATRRMLLGAGSPSLHLFGASITVTLLCLAGGVLVFQRVEKNFVDVI